MDFLNINESVRTSLRIAQGIAREYGNETYTPAHLLKAILNREIGLHGFVESLGKDLAYVIEWAEIRIEELPKVGPVTALAQDSKIDHIMEHADTIRLKWGLLEINPVCVLAAISTPEVGFSADHLKSFPIRENEIHKLYTTTDHSKQKGFEALSDEYSISTSSTLHKYCIDKTLAVSNGSYTPIVSRDKESRMIREILGRHSKPNVLIIGDAGVGKTALVDGLALDIVNKKVPSYLEGSTILELDCGALIAGATYKGEIEDRLKNILNDLRTIDRAILFIDEIHVLLDPKLGNTGAAGILKPELSKGDLTVIGITTIDEYRKIVEPDHAFSRRFEVLQVDEPDDTAARLMLDAVLQKYIDYHHIKLDQASVGECIRLARRYVKDRRLPDAAIDLLDRTMSAIKMVNETAKNDILELIKAVAAVEESQEKTMEERADKLRLINLSMQNKLSPVLLGMLTQEKDTKEIENYHDWNAYLNTALDTLLKFIQQPIETITPHEVAAIVSNKTGIPIGKIQSHEKERLLNMEELLRRRVVGQDQALKALVDAILESRSGMNKPGQPIGSFFLLGPTGTGKTELAKALAEVLFNDEKAMIRFDMSEFKEEHSAALLYGAPPGYVGYEEGGMLVNKIRQQAYSVVLFDEIEKAHASVYDTFLQIMDEGKLHDRLGKEGDFSNAIVLFTSNVGSQWLLQQREQGKTPSNIQLMEVMGEYFRPEFLARISEIVPFNPITEDVLLKIFDIQFKGVVNILEKQGIMVEITDNAKLNLANKGFTSKYGARQVAGTIRNYIRRPISRMIIGGQLHKGDCLRININEAGEPTFDVTD